MSLWGVVNLLFTLTASVIALECDPPKDCATMWECCGEQCNGQMDYETSLCYPLTTGGVDITGCNCQEVGPFDVTCYVRSLTLLQWSTFLCSELMRKLRK